MTARPSMAGPIAEDSRMKVTVSPVGNSESLVTAAIFRLILPDTTRPSLLLRPAFVFEFPYSPLVALDFALVPTRDRRRDFGTCTKAGYATVVLRPNRLDRPVESTICKGGPRGRRQLVER